MKTTLTYQHKLVTGLLFLSFTLLTSLCFASSALADNASIESLRGSNPIDQPSKEPLMQRWADDGEPIARNYVQQPPLIPHKVQGYKINLKFNKCLTCHSWANYQDSGATKVSLTHFNDRDGNTMSNVSARRYFCTQCHVPQTNAKPLVENTFQPVQTIKRNH